MYTLIALVVAVALSLFYSLVLNLPFVPLIALSMLTGAVAGWIGAELDYRRDIYR